MHNNSDLFFVLGHLDGSFCGFSFPGTRLWFAYCSSVCNDNRYLQNTKVRFLLISSSKLVFADLLCGFVCLSGTNKQKTFPPSSTACSIESAS